MDMIEFGIADMQNGYTNYKKLTFLFMTPSSEGVILSNKTLNVALQMV